MKENEDKIKIKSACFLMNAVLGLVGFEMLIAEEKHRCYIQTHESRIFTMKLLNIVESGEFLLIYTHPSQSSAAIARNAAVYRRLERN